MLVSVIVPNLHSPIIEKTLDSLRSQTYKGTLEIIVVGQDKYHLVKEDDLVRHLITPTPVSSAVARNLGIAASQGDIIAFIDSDCVANSDWLERLMAHYSSPDVSIIGGGVTFPTENYWTLCDNIASFYEYLITSPKGIREQLPSLNLSVRRKVLDQVGLFDERYPLPAGEDADLTTRMRIHGYKLFFDPQAAINHLPIRRSVKSIFKHAYNFGRYSIKVDKRYKDYLKIPFFLRTWWLTVLFSPFLAGGVMIKMLANPMVLRNAHTLPVMFLFKIWWCFGAAQTLRTGSAIQD